MPPLATSRPSSCRATLQTPPVWPRSVVNEPPAARRPRSGRSHRGWRSRRCRPSADSATAQTPAEWPRSRWRSRPLATSQRRTVPSWLPLTTRRSSALIATPQTPSVCPRQVARGWPPEASQSRRVPSSLPLATQLTVATQRHAPHLTAVPAQRRQRSPVRPCPRCGPLRPRRRWRPAGHHRSAPRPTPGRRARVGPRAAPRRRPARAAPSRRDRRWQRAARPRSGPRPRRRPSCPRSVASKRPCRVPESNRLVVAATGDQPSVPAQRHAAHPAPVPLQGRQQAPARELPELHGLIGAAARHESPVGSQGDAVHRAAVTVRAEHEPPGRDVPDAGRPVVAAAAVPDPPSALSATPRIPLACPGRAASSVAVGDTPDAHLARRRPGREVGAVGAERERLG